MSEELEIHRLRGGPPPEHLKLEHMVSAEKIREMLHKTLDLTDEAFEDMVDDIGARTARLVLRAAAVSGNIKAIELYFKIVKETKASRRSKDVKVSATPENAAFVRTARAVEPDDHH